MGGGWGACRMWLLPTVSNSGASATGTPPRDFPSGRPEPPCLSSAAPQRARTGEARLRGERGVAVRVQEVGSRVVAADGREDA